VREANVGAKQSAEEVAFYAQRPSAAKAGIDFAQFTARLEAAPFQNKVKIGVSSAAC
jgi:hypothetical protein